MRQRLSDMDMFKLLRRFVTWEMPNSVIANGKFILRCLNLANRQVLIGLWCIDRRYFPRVGLFFCYTANLRKWEFLISREITAPVTIPTAGVAPSD